MEDNLLWDNYKKYRSNEIREELIIRYAGLVKIVAGRLNIYTNHQIQYDDLISYGIFGLIDAIDKFDNSKGYKFETYASLRIRGEIIDNIRRLDWIPRSLRQKNKRLQNAIYEFELENNIEPTDEQLAKILEMNINEVKDLIKNSSVYNLISLDGYLEQAHEKISEALTLDESYLPEIAIQKQEQKNEIKNAINLLKDKQKQVITLYYYEELTLKEISKIMEISESRVSQIHSNSIKILKSKLGKNYTALF